MKKVYLDHAAAAPLDRKVASAMRPYFSASFGNASSMHASGRRSAAALSDARARIARVIGAAPENVIFTGSGTESDNLAVRGASRAARTHGKHIVISSVEHKAVLESAHALEREGYEVSYAPVDAFGRVDPRRVLSLVRKDTTLVSIMLANNEIGTVEPIAEIASLLSERKRETGGFPILHTDACQAAGYLPIDIKSLNADMMTLNGSKAYGPRGVGVLYKKHDVMLEPLIVGGTQEYGMRAGTESIPLAVGMAEALERAEQLRETETARLAALRRHFTESLERAVPGIIINGHPQHVLPHIVHVTVPLVEGESLVLLLDDAGVECATGSACSANDLRPSHVLSAIGQSGELIHGSIRFSMGRDTDAASIDRVMEVFPGIVERLKKTSALTTALLYEKTT